MALLRLPAATEFLLQLVGDTPTSAAAAIAALAPSCATRPTSTRVADPCWHGNAMLRRVFEEKIRDSGDTGRGVRKPVRRSARMHCHRRIKSRHSVVDTSGIPARATSAKHSSRPPVTHASAHAATAGVRLIPRLQKTRGRHVARTASPWYRRRRATATAGCRIRHSGKRQYTGSRVTATWRLVQREIDERGGCRPRGRRAGRGRRRRGRAKGSRAGSAHRGSASPDSHRGTVPRLRCVALGSNKIYIETRSVCRRCAFMPLSNVISL